MSDAMTRTFRPRCPVHGVPKATWGGECPDCGGEGTIHLEAGMWEAACDTCGGSGLRYECPACDAETDTAAEEAREDEEWRGR